MHAAGAVRLYVQRGACPAITGAEAVHTDWHVQVVADRHVHGGPFRHSDEGSRDGERSTFLAEGVNGQRGAAMTFGLPPSSGGAQPEGEGPVLDDAGWTPVVIGEDGHQPVGGDRLGGFGARRHDDDRESERGAQPRSKPVSALMGATPALQHRPCVSVRTYCVVTHIALEKG
jgi:hypothetical protein